MMGKNDRVIVGTYTAEDSGYYRDVVENSHLVETPKEFHECYVKPYGMKVLNQCFAESPEAFEQLIKDAKLKVIGENSFVTKDDNSNIYGKGTMFYAKRNDD